MTSGDPGAIVALLLHHVTLQPGEAMFLDAGVLHLYLHGVGLEVMGSSDNVMRGGLTPKYVDVQELVMVLDSVSTPPPLKIYLPMSSLELIKLPQKTKSLANIASKSLSMALQTPKSSAVLAVITVELQGESPPKEVEK